MGVDDRDQHEDDSPDQPAASQPQPESLPWDTLEPAAGSPAPVAAKPLIAQDVEPLVAEPEPELQLLPDEPEPSEEDLEPAPAMVLKMHPDPGPDHRPEDGEEDAYADLRIGLDAGGATATARTGGGGWTIVALCAGIAIIACCLVIPQTDANRRLAWEREKLKLDLEAVRKQVAVNTDFLRKLPDDPTLAERLAQRQMRMVREGTSILKLKGGQGSSEMNPFLLTAVAAPDPLPPYQSPKGLLSDVFLAGRTRLYATGAGLLLVAGGLVLGYAPKRD
jgi:hypothetical protein